MGITTEDFEKMKARVAGAVENAAAPVRATLPQKFVIMGHAVSVNKSRVSFTGADGKTKTVKTKEAAQWAKMMNEQLRKQWGIRLPIEEEVFVIMDFYFSSNRNDYANAEKGCSDALQAAGILRNDRLIRRGTITKYVDKHRPRVEIHLYPSNLTTL